MIPLTVQTNAFIRWCRKWKRRREKERKIYAMVSCSRFWWVTNSSDHMRVWTKNFLHLMQLSNAPGRKSLWSSGLGGCISYKRLAFLSLLCCDPSISRASHHYSFKLQSKLKYLTKNTFGINEFVKVHLLKLPAALPHPPTPSYPYDQLFLSCAVSPYYYTTIPCI